MGRTPQQAGAMARRKGNVFQNVVAKMLTDAWGVPILWTPMSGGLSIRGDLMVGGSPPKFALTVNIECKHRQDITLRRVLLEPSRIPVEPEQVVFFKDDGVIWVAWDVLNGPNIGPPQFGMKYPPVFIRARSLASVLTGLVRVNYDPGFTWLQNIKGVMLRRVGEQSNGKSKKGGMKELIMWHDEIQP
jgi:hypothetical protein